MPAFGATRIWHYTSEAEAIKDALRLSNGMSHKAALAGLHYGGAKAVLFDGQKNLKEKQNLIKAYAEKVNYLRGSFITGADVGVDPADVRLMRSVSKYIVGLSTDPVKYTVLGTYYAIQSCVQEVFASSSFKKRTFAIQGLGKTGYALLRMLYPDAHKIYVCDIDGKRVNLAKKEFPNIEVVHPGVIFKQEADVYCPCALGSVFTLKNVDSLRCKIICGNANDQLENPLVGEKLYKKGILYAPDYVVNAGGLIAVVEEYENPRVSNKRIAEKVHGIKKRVKEIIQQSKKTHKATNTVADEIAQKIFDSLQ